MNAGRLLGLGLGFAGLLGGIWACSAAPEGGAVGQAELNQSEPAPRRAAQTSVLQHHGNGSRDGFYVDPSLTADAIATLHRDRSFNGAVTGKIYAQPLYVENGPAGREAFIVATEENHLVALDGSGNVIWDKSFGPPATSNLPCGNIRPLGITGTPAIDLATRTVFFDSMTTPDNNRTFKHQIWGVSLDDGSPRDGWPVDFNRVTNASAAHHNQRGAIGIVNGNVYVPYGGHFGDCDPYRGTVVTIPSGNPTRASYWAIAGKEGGIWAHGGTASDGSSIFVATGNTDGATGWAGGEAIIRLGTDGNFSNQRPDYFAPENWKQLDNGDVDLGGSNPVVVDMPGAPFPHLVLAFGKDTTLYITNRDNLGGIGGQLSSLKVAANGILGAATSYKTANGTYVAFRGRGVNCPGASGTGAGNMAAVKILPENPPRAVMAWCVEDRNLGSPMATSTDGLGKAVVWNASTKLFGYDGDTGAKVYSDADTMEQPMHYFNTPIPAGGRIAIATPGKLVVYTP